VHDASCAKGAIIMNTVETTIEPASIGRAQTIENRAAARADYSVALGYLRALVTLLVLAHHAALAYHPIAPATAPASLAAEPRWWLAFPVIDSQRSSIAMLLVAFNDIFFMSLMFFLSGLFVWSSLQRKGRAIYLRDRLMRLGAPFVVSAAVLAPLAYYPAYLTRTTDASFGGFWSQWTALGQWPAGPAWFIWVLLAFGGVVAAVTSLVPTWGDVLGRWVRRIDRSPAAVFVALVALSSVAYIPLSLAVSPLEWAAWGPFNVQTSRVLHYAVYFLAGLAIGAAGLGRGLLSADGALARRWWAWTLGMLAAFVVAIVIFITASTASAQQSPTFWGIAGGAAFALSCAASSFGLAAIVLRFTRGRVRLFDRLNEHAYGMYLVHYAFASWLQYALLAAPMPGTAKFMLVFVGTVVLSFVAVAMMRRVPAVARVI
jgi:peptidoglycan/LPS O-acetylase OafA/YrhL